MSTYYKFRCPKCKEAGGFFSRQMWGWGNCDIFSNFKFAVAHADCPSLQIVSEHEEAWFDGAEKLAWLERLHGDEHLRDHVWPHASEWAWVKDDWEGAHAKWRKESERELANERSTAERREMAE